MSKRIRIHFDNKEVWSVSAETVAKNKADYYYKGKDCYNEQYSYIINDYDGLIDWLENNMDWDDFKECRELESKEDEYDYNWKIIDAFKEVV